MMTGTEGSTTTTAPGKGQLPLQSLFEESVKAALYAALAAHATNSLWNNPSQSMLSMAFHAVVVLISGKALVEELHFLFFERPKLPPGSLGLPFLGDIVPLVTRYKGGLFPMTVDKAKEYGSINMTMILGNTLVTLSDSASLTWLWNNDRKSLTESSWPPNIQALLGPTAVANLQGRQHKILRRLMEPFYSPTFVANYLKVMVETTDDDLEEWCDSGALFGRSV
jgi:hypothetical protein